MAHAFHQTVVDEEEIHALIKEQLDIEVKMVEALAVEPVSPRRSPRLRFDNPSRQSPGTRPPRSPSLKARPIVRRRIRSPPPSPFLRPPVLGGVQGSSNAIEEESPFRVPASFPSQPIPYTLGTTTLHDPEV